MRLIDADALLRQIGIDSVKICPGQYGDEWRFMGTIDSAPVLMTEEEYQIAKRMLEMLYQKLDERMLNGIDACDYKQTERNKHETD